jgi:hypothetical protein
MFFKRAFCVLLLLTISLMFPLLSFSAEPSSTPTKTTEALKARIESLEKSLAQTKKEVGTIQQTQEAGIHIGGALRVNYGYLDWNQGSHDRGGDFSFDTFRLDMKGEIGKILFNAEYRFYPEYGFNTVHHGWFGYNFTKNLQGQIGVNKVPFGILPFASHSYWFSGAYYVGLEDDYDLGVKSLYHHGPWNLALAFYKNAELGDAGNANRYSIDVINNADGGYAGAQAAGNEETNQVNARVAYTFDHGKFGSTTVGVSGMWGQLYNNITGDTGDHWAGAVHLNGNYGRWNLQLEGIDYAYYPKDPANADKDIITMGAYGYSWGVPAKALIGTANLAYGLPVSWGPIQNLLFYSDNTVISPIKDRFPTIWQNVVGMLIHAGPVYTYVDLISGRHMIFMGGDMVGGPGASGGRNTRLNINFGYYF